MLRTVPLFPFMYLLGSVLAHPVEDNLSKRICGTILMPSTLRALKANEPSTTFPNTATTDGSVLIYQDLAGGQSTQITNIVKELIAFTGPPPGSYGCTLGITFPSNYQFQYYSGVTPTLNIYSIALPLPTTPNYVNIAPGSLWGAVTVQAGQSTVINSQVCPTAQEGGLAFVLGYADWVTQPGSIGWNEKAGATPQGVYLSYNC